MKTIYKGDTRYEKIASQMELLSITDVSTSRQVKNGTIVWRLPIKINYRGNAERFIEVASFATGYVRNQNCGYSNYQLNKRCDSKPEYYKHSNGYYSKHITRSCVLIPIEIDRLEYLMSYCLKNYYIKHANFVADGKYVPEWYHNNKVNDCSHYDRINDLKEKLDNMTNKLSNAISPTKYQCAINKLHDLENKLATINRISSNE